MNSELKKILEWGDSYIKDRIKDCLDSNIEIRNNVLERALAGKPMQFTSEFLSPNLKLLYEHLISDNNRTRLIRQLLNAVQDKFSEKYGFDIWVDLQRDDKIVISLDGFELHKTKFKETIDAFKDGIKKDQIPYAISVITRYECVEKWKMVSKIDITKYVTEKLEEYGHRIEDPRDAQLVRKVISNVFDDVDTFKIIKNICIMHGKADDKIQFDSSQTDEMAYYLKTKYHLKRIRDVRGKITNIVLIWDYLDSKKKQGFENKIYEIADKEMSILRKELQGDTGKNDGLCYKPIESTKKEVIAKCVDLADIIDEKQIVNDLPVRLLNNCYYCTKCFKRFLEVDPDKFIVTVNHPITYDPTAKCPNLHKYMLNAVRHNKDGYRTKISLIHLWESMSWVFINDLTLDKHIFYIGTTAQNGKTVFLKFQDGLFGSRKMKSVPLEKITNNRFSVAGLHGIIYNKCGDISSDKITHTEDFQKLATRDEMYGEYKGVDSFNFYPYCINTFSVNEPPEFENTGDKIFRRILPIPFPNKFINNPTKEDIERGYQKIDRELVDKMETDRERSGAFNVCMKFAKGLRNRHAFSYEPSDDDVRDYWLGEANHIVGFTRSKVYELRGAFIIADELEDSYHVWCKYMKRRSLTHNDFINRYEHECPINTHHKQETNKANGKMVWTNMWWKNVSLPLDDDNKPMFTCQGCLDKNHKNCEYSFKLNKEEHYRCKCADNEHDSKQANLPQTQNGRPIKACDKCSNGHHNLCEDKDRCLCGSKDHILNN